MRVTVLGLFFALWISISTPTAAAQIDVAVAANFTAPMLALAPLFEQASGHQLRPAFGSSGQFYAQIQNGAPFAVLLSADHSVPQRLIEEDLAVAESLFTYATGALVLWSAQADFLDGSPARLEQGDFNYLAIANPQLAPYGLAAQQTLAHLGLSQALKGKLVEGQNIGQAFQFVASGNAQLGFVALSQVMRDGVIPKGSAWQVPADFHQPIAQDAVLLKSAQHNPAAIAFLEFLRSPKALQIIKSYGYLTP